MKSLSGFAWAAAIAIAFAAGCSKPSAPQATSAQGEAAKTGPAEYRASGEIVDIDSSAQIIKFKAGKIEGWMDAMTMDYPVKDKQEFQKLKIGEKINANVLVQGPDYWLENITPAAPETPAAKPPTK